MSSQKYNVLLLLRSGGFQVLEHRKATAFSKATANKHGDDILKAIEAGISPWVNRYKDVELCVDDYSAPSIPVKRKLN